MILFDADIKAAIERGHINITPFDERNLGPNSYDVRLGSKLYVYTRPDDGVLDMKKRNPVKSFDIPYEGLVLQPGELYLGHTMEHFGASHNIVPHLEGRSSIGRLGMAIHVTAGFGDCGFFGCWTMEIIVQLPLRVYAGERVAQAYFILGQTKPERYYEGKYANFIGAVPSMMDLDRR